MKAIGLERNPPSRGRKPRAPHPVAALTRADDLKVKAAVPA
ncbi:MAG TPA: hypothetical protein VNY52_05000 [Solirubrobacteraceae bacterium]|nr:hypothetical protein [Solirubrobacteraceae bacterium]